MLEPVYIIAVDTAEKVSERQYAESLIYFLRKRVIAAPPDPNNVRTTMVSLPNLQSKLENEFMHTVALLLGAMTEKHPEYAPFITITDDTYSQRDLDVTIRQAKIPNGYYTCVIHVKKQRS